MGFNWHHTLSETLHGNRWSWLSFPSSSSGLEMSTSLEMLTMLLVLEAEFLPSVMKVWFKDREKGSRDSGESFFFHPHQTMYICAEHANLFDIESSSGKKVFCFSRRGFRFFALIAVASYCRVVCEANIKLLLMIYWVGFNALLPCLPCNLQYFNNNRRNGFIFQNEIGDTRGDILRF